MTETLGLSFVRATADKIEAVDFASQLFKSTMGARRVLVVGEDHDTSHPYLDLYDETQLSERLQAYESQIKAQMSNPKVRPLKKN